MEYRVNHNENYNWLATLQFLKLTKTLLKSDKKEKMCEGYSVLRGAERKKTATNQIFFFSDPCTFFFPFFPFHPPLDLKWNSHKINRQGFLFIVT